MFGRKKEIRRKLDARYGSNPLRETRIYQTEERLAQIKIYHDSISDPEDPYQIDEITWSDLEMDQIFLRINHTDSYIGEQVLYHKLHCVGQAGDRNWSDYEKALQKLDQDKELRLDLQYRLSSIGKRQANYYLPMFLCNTADMAPKHSWIFRVMQGLLLIFLLLSIITRLPVFLAGLAGVAIVNFMIYLVMKLRYDMVLGSLAGVGAMLSFCADLLSKQKNELPVSDEVRDAIGKVSLLRRKIGNYVFSRYGSMNGDIIALINEYLMGITLIDVARLASILKFLDQYQDQIMLLYEFTGSMDLMISVASYRKSVPGYCVPDIRTSGGLAARQIYHPLLDEPVRNDFILTNRAMITGANASGKSTFMKTLAVDVILAQTIHTCTAESFVLPPLTVMTSMAIRDDVVSGESYYIREVRYLKRMLDVIDQGTPVLCVIDEILKGTNQKERLLASKAVLRYIAEKSCFCVVATHDRELLDDLRDGYDCYYFESHIADENVLFDYLIHSGNGGGTNAIALLRSFHFPEEILEAVGRE